MISASVGDQEALGMRFVLSYEGVLPSSGNAFEKHAIRKQFHPQLKRQWEVDPALRGFAQRNVKFEDGAKPMLQVIADTFTVGGFRCVPLVQKRLDLTCYLSISFMRHEEPGQLVRHGGDIDNRIKTLFDSLTKPNNDQVAHQAPENEENPFYCLLEDDSLITGFEVKTERLLQATHNPQAVRLLITAVVRPSHANEDNLPFLGGWL
jgi:hypothetical protein